MRVSKREAACLDEAAFWQPKKLSMFMLMAFVFAMFAARFFSAMQRAGYISTGPNIIGDFHFHHYAYSMIFLAVLIPLGFLARNNKPAFALIAIGIAFFFGLFIDGIVYYDSPIFFESAGSSMVLDPVSTEDMVVLLCLGAALLGSTIVATAIHFQDKNKCIRR